MNVARTGKLLAGVLLSAALAGSSGCSRKVWITYYPSFFDEQAKTVAVVPFRNHTGAGGAGRFVADAIAEALTENGAYRVLNPEVLTKQLGEAKLAIGPGDDATAIAAKLRQLGGVDAFIHGDVTAFAVDADSGYAFAHVHHHGHYYYGHRGFYGLGYDYVWYPFPRTAGTVGAQARMIRVADGEELYAMGRPARVTAYANGYGAGKWLDNLLGYAANRLATQFVRRVAPAPLRIRIKPGEALRTARLRQNGRFKGTDTFTVDKKDLYVELRLPPEADRNLFHVVITPEDSTEALASRTVVWNGDQRLHRLRFSLQDFVDKAGYGDYVVRVYTGDAEILSEDFEIQRR